MKSPLLCALGLACSMTLAPVAQACDGIAFDSDTIHAAPICLADTPKRVVVLDPTFSLGIGMDVGLPIVGAAMARLGDKTLLAEAQAAGITDLGQPTEPSLERIAALQPDLILAFVGNDGLAEQIHPLFSQIAPTLLETSVDWRAYYDTLLRLTDDGKRAEIAARLAAFDARKADVATRVPQDRTVSILRITSWDLQVNTDNPSAYAPFALLRDLGVKRSAYETGPGQGGVLRPDWEELEGLDGDVLLYIVGGTNDSDKDGRHEEVLNHPLWQMLPAVQSGDVHRIEHGTWMEFNGLRAAHRVLDDVETYVIGGQTGD